MWIDFSKASSCELNYLAAVGRALVLSQHFEYTCKDVLCLFDFVKGVREGKEQDLDTWQNIAEKTMENRLANAVKKYGNVHGTTEGNLSLLDMARLARNYIAHDAALLWYFPSNDDLRLSARISTLREAANDLAAAHNLVSDWGYSMKNIKPPPPALESTYVHRAVGWVMEPLQSTKELQSGTRDDSSSQMTDSPEPSGRDS
ncbi:MAG: hypothetical protein KKG33_01420 [candidate division Zixibacteria bacterium]|nr:hypothetical protein [candidate division Zixibacteria bacterium]MBU1469446.1 hypothetical protein [candidate division Zixibacteria bacterium]MBU2624200.1 hypothetical protein [candidate division Zixibacteria bacterium]